MFYPALDNPTSASLPIIFLYSGPSINNVAHILMDPRLIIERSFIKRSIIERSIIESLIWTYYRNPSKFNRNCVFIEVFFSNIFIDTLTLHSTKSKVMISSHTYRTRI